MQSHRRRWLSPLVTIPVALMAAGLSVVTAQSSCYFPNGTDGKSFPKPFFCFLDITSSPELSYHQGSSRTQINNRFYGTGKANHHQQTACSPTILSISLATPNTLLACAVTSATDAAPMGFAKAPRLLTMFLGNSAQTKLGKAPAV